MTESIQAQQFTDALRAVSIALQTSSEYLTSLDQAMGDGDLGINMDRIGSGLQEYLQTAETADLGKFMAGAGMAANRAAPSTMGTLLATALMRAGKVIMGKSEVSAADLGAMFTAAAQGIQERGKAQLGNKTILDALYPAAEAFNKAVTEGLSLADAGKQALTAAEAGRDSVTPLRSQIGRAGWVGERTMGLVDPGCEALVTILKSLVK